MWILTELITMHQLPPYNEGYIQQSRQGNLNMAQY
jgi:hypothetical protein